VTTLAFDPEKCIGCGKCTEVCPHRVFDLSGGKARIVERDLCMECGACALNCPAQAIEVHAGVGCAAAIIMSWFSGKEPACGCSDDSDSVCC
jgi:NAD-dependent dihydropyrimidine dehydrogenase PreA subunit